jgi:conjugative relaxase-like TrwC/TraI family protein
LKEVDLYFLCKPRQFESKVWERKKMIGELIVHRAGNAAADAAYLYQGAMQERSQEERNRELGRAYANGTLDVNKAVQSIMPMIRRQITDDLALALEAAGGLKYVEQLRKGELDGLTLSQWEYATADHLMMLADVNNPLRLEEQGFQYLQSEGERAVAHGVMSDDVVRLRPDTSERLAKVLNVNPAMGLDQGVVRRLFAGRQANGRKVEGKRLPHDAAAWIEIPVSAPKSVSVEWGQAQTPEQKWVLEDAHSQAVAVMMHKVADRAGRIRLSEDRSKGFEKADITWISFLHTTNNKGEPDLHSHVALLNIGASQTSKRVQAIDNQQLNGQIRGLREVYARQLAKNLTRLGYQIDFQENRLEARIAAVPRELEQAFSQRSIEIRAKAHEIAINRHGMEFSQLTKLHQDRLLAKATLMTRSEQKPADPAKWKQIAEQHGYVSPTVYADRAAAVGLEVGPELAPELAQRAPGPAWRGEGGRDAGHRRPSVEGVSAQLLQLSNLEVEGWLSH